MDVTLKVSRDELAVVRDALVAMRQSLLGKAHWNSGNAERTGVRDLVSGVYFREADVVGALLGKVNSVKGSRG